MSSSREEMTRLREPLGWSATAPTLARTLEAALPVDAAGARPGYLLAKRALDVLATGLGLALLAPLFLLIAVAIYFDDGGPVLFRQRRVGENEREFICLKFRTMFRDAEQRQDDLAQANEASGPVFKMRQDPRITRVGRWLRRSSLDELPQLLNILRGEMTLVGPRPPVPKEVALYTPSQRQRLLVRPGLTCLWQISGRSLIGFERWMELDLEYIRRRSLLLDLWILWRTAPAVISGRGAY